MKKKIIFTSLLALMFTFVPQWAASGVEQPNIRVGLDQGINKADFRVHSGEYEIIDGSGMPLDEVSQGDTWSVEKEGPTLKVMCNSQEACSPIKDSVRVRPKNGDNDNVFSFEDTKYRNELNIYNGDDGLIVVNVLPLDQYLYGVVGEEMGYSASSEALKAQAVVSRSYALSCKGSGPYYDVGTDTMTQVYGGYSAESSSQADKVKDTVDATRGEVVVYNGEVIKAFYHANAGGYTENSENIWENSLPYLKSVSSPLDRYASRYSSQSRGWPADSYEWEKEFSRSELKETIEEWNERQEEAENNDRVIDIGSIEDIKINRSASNGSGDTESGRVSEINFIGDKGEKSFFRDDIRSVLGLKSTLFDISFDSEIHVLGSRDKKAELNSGGNLMTVNGEAEVEEINRGGNEYYVIGKEAQQKFSKQFKNIIIKGKGHGHGLGLSQWGARGMAAENASYKDIINHYYSNIKIDKIY